jgi:hypothetical protein
MSGSMQEPFGDHRWTFPLGRPAPGAGDRPEEALARVEHLLGASHVSALRRADEHESFEVVAAAGPGFVGPGVRLPMDTSDVACVALAGHIASIELELSEAPLEALAYAAGLEAAIALPVRPAPEQPVAGAVVIAWSGTRASTEAAEWAVDRERAALSELLLAAPV